MQPRPVRHYSKFNLRLFRVINGKLYYIYGKTFYNSRSYASKAINFPSVVRDFVSSCGDLTMVGEWRRSRQGLKSWKSHFYRLLLSHPHLWVPLPFDYAMNDAEVQYNILFIFRIYNRLFSTFT